MEKLKDAFGYELNVNDIIISIKSSRYRSSSVNIIKGRIIRFTATRIYYTTDINSVNEQVETLYTSYSAPHKVVKLHADNFIVAKIEENNTIIPICDPLSLKHAKTLINIEAENNSNNNYSIIKMLTAQEIEEIQ